MFRTKYFLQKSGSRGRPWENEQDSVEQMNRMRFENTGCGFCLLKNEQNSFMSGLKTNFSSNGRREGVAPGRKNEILLKTWKSGVFSAWVLFYIHTLLSQTASPMGILYQICPQRSESRGLRWEENILKARDVPFCLIKKASRMGVSQWSERRGPT